MFDYWLARGAAVLQDHATFCHIEQHRQSIAESSERQFLSHMFNYLYRKVQLWLHMGTGEIFNLLSPSLIWVRHLPVGFGDKEYNSHSWMVFIFNFAYNILSVLSFLVDASGEFQCLFLANPQLQAWRVWQIPWVVQGGDPLREWDTPCIPLSKWRKYNWVTCRNSSS